MRWTAPADTTSITLASGTLNVVDGAVDLPDDATDGDRLGLIANGFRIAPDSDPAPTVEPAKPAKPAKAPDTPAPGAAAPDTPATAPADPSAQA